MSEAPPFAPPTSAQLAGSASVLPRVSPPTPSRCNPVAFGLKPRESVPHLGPQSQISCFNQDSAKAEAPPFAPPTSAQLAGNASVLPRVYPTTPSRCNPVAFGLKPRESVPHLGPQGQISCFNQDSAKSEAPLFAPQTSAQLAGSASVLLRVSPPTPSRCNPVAFGLKPREFVQHLGPQGQISCFNQDSAKSEASPFAPPTLAKLLGSAVCSPGCPLQHLLGVTPLPLDLSPENLCRTWEPRAEFRVLIRTRQSPRLHRSRPRPRPN